MNESLDGSESISSAQDEADGPPGMPPETPCPYLPDRKFRGEAYTVEGIDSETYELLIGHGFRRCGQFIYRPRCNGCRECRQLRVPVWRFRPTRSMRRIQRRNADLHVEIAEATPTPDKFEMYLRYLNARHDETMARTYESFVDFLYGSPIDTREIRYHVGRRLAGVSIADWCPDGLSSVYMYFEPDFSDRSLGTMSVLWEIDYCRREGLSYYYLGFFVPGGAAMEYKARFRPNEVLVGSEHWMTLRE